MAKFTVEEAASATAIEQLINDWAYDLDMHHGANIGDFVTEDCAYIMGPNTNQGREAVRSFYRQRVEKLTAASPTMPTARHCNFNLRTSFRSPSEASITFNLLFFTTEGNSGNVADPVAVADVWMDCRRDADGDWKISRFDSKQPIKRAG